MSCRIEQHLPGYVSGVEPKSAEVESVEDFATIWWIEGWSREEGFWRFAYADGRHEAGGPNHLSLMAEFEEGRKWVLVGSLSELLPDLPHAIFEDNEAKASKRLRDGPRRSPSQTTDGG